MKLTGSRATVSAVPVLPEKFLPLCPIVSVKEARRAVKMAQARRLASTLNGYPLTIGVSSRIDFTYLLAAESGIAILIRKLEVMFLFTGANCWLIEYYVVCRWKIF